MSVENVERSMKLKNLEINCNCTIEEAMPLYDEHPQAATGMESCKCDVVHDGKIIGVIDFNQYGISVSGDKDVIINWRK